MSIHVINHKQGDCHAFSVLSYFSPSLRQNRINNSQTGAEKYKSQRVIQCNQTLCGVRTVCSPKVTSGSGSQCDLSESLWQTTSSPSLSSRRLPVGTCWYLYWEKSSQVSQDQITDQYRTKQAMRDQTTATHAHVVWRNALSQTCHMTDGCYKQSQMWVFKHAMYIKNFKKIIKQINTKHKNDKELHVHLNT